MHYDVGVRKHYFKATEDYDVIGYDVILAFKDKDYYMTHKKWIINLISNVSKLSVFSGSSSVEISITRKFRLTNQNRSEVQDILKMNSTDTVTLGRFYDCVSI